MKRLVILLLAAVLVISCGSALADHDPIVGAWYTYLGMADHAEGQEVYQRFMMQLMFFNEDGTVDAAIPSCNGQDIQSTRVTRIGHWANMDGTYYLINELNETVDTVVMSGNAMIARISGDAFHAFVRLLNVTEAQQFVMETLTNAGY